jgi:hypothetical protein
MVMELSGNKTYRNNQPSNGAIVGVPRTLSTRWVPRRKAQVVAAVGAGVLSLEEACRRYALTEEEFRSWESAIDRFGLAGLRATHALDYRSRK